MQQFIDLYNKDTELTNELLDGPNTEVTLKLEGISLQVYYNDETGKYEYRKHSSEIALGPIITRLEKYFCKPLYDAIGFIKTKLDLIEPYRFLNFVIHEKELILISAMTKEDPNIIDDAQKISEIAMQLGIKGVMCLWSGRLTEEQQHNITNMVNFNALMASSEFKNYVKTLFTSPANIGNYCCTNVSFPYELFDKLKYIPGIVLNFHLTNGKVVQCEIPDTQYKQYQEDLKAKRKLQKSINKAFAEDLVVTITEWLERNMKHYSDQHMENMEKNFIHMVSNTKMYNKLMNVCAKLPINTDEIYKLQFELFSPELQTLCHKFGNNFKTIFENYLIMFYHTKENSIIIDKDFTKRLNKVISQL